MSFCAGCRACLRLPARVKPSPNPTAPREVSSDVIDSYIHRIEAYATMIVVGSLIFGFAATTSVSPPRDETSFEELRQVSETCLLMVTLAASAFTVVTASMIVYHALKIASTVGLAAFSFKEDDRNPSHMRRLRAEFDRYFTASGHFRGVARFMLFVAFVCYLFAVGISKASSVTRTGGIIVGIALFCGMLGSVVAVRSLSYEYRVVSVALAQVHADFDIIIKESASTGNGMPASPTKPIADSHAISIVTGAHQADAVATNTVHSLA